MASYDNLNKLTNELLGAGLLIDGIDCNGIISWHDGHPTGTDEADAQAIIDAHDPTDYVAIRKSDAEDGIKNIPNWALLSPQEAKQWVTDNVSDLTTAKQVLERLVLLVLIHSLFQPFITPSNN